MISSPSKAPAPTSTTPSAPCDIFSDDNDGDGPSPPNIISSQPDGLSSPSSGLPSPAATTSPSTCITGEPSVTIVEPTTQVNQPSVTVMSTHPMTTRAKYGIHFVQHEKSHEKDTNFLLRIQILIVVFERLELELWTKRNVHPVEVHDSQVGIRR
ncbi:unnamed protein product [Lactuca virosa]|uniref:Uncharacterized protein n=1 Tax=Lactuca virosa TaxID=75947 RepID=A0AAU9NI26_9ASTR|nr:unnamed protein product [Lactuca virosa]